jgi:hypothetical protein
VLHPGNKAALLNQNYAKNSTYDHKPAMLLACVACADDHFQPRHKKLFHSSLSKQIGEKWVKIDGQQPPSCLSKQAPQSAARAARRALPKLRRCSSSAVVDDCCNAL